MQGDFVGDLGFLADGVFDPAELGFVQDAAAAADLGFFGADTDAVLGFLSAETDALLGFQRDAALAELGYLQANVAVTGDQNNVLASALARVQLAGTGNLFFQSALLGANGFLGNDAEAVLGFLSGDVESLLGFLQAGGDAADLGYLQARVRVDGDQNLVRAAALANVAVLGAQNQFQQTALVGDLGFLGGDADALLGFLNDLAAAELGFLQAGGDAGELGFFPATVDVAGNCNQLAAALAHISANGHGNRFQQSELAGDLGFLGDVTAALLGLLDAGAAAGDLGFLRLGVALTGGSAQAQAGLFADVAFGAGEDAFTQKLHVGDVALLNGPADPTDFGLRVHPGDDWAAKFTDEDLSTASGDVIDTAYDQLTGSSGSDWFIVSSGDKVTDYKTKQGDVIDWVVGSDGRRDAEPAVGRRVRRASGS